MLRKVLITGGAGFIGSHLAEACQSWATVRVLDDLSSGRRENLSSGSVEFQQGSILSPADLDRAVDGVDVVFHLAAFVSVAASMESPEACAQLNVIGTLNVLRAAENAGVKRLIFASSAAVYGDDPTVPKVEEMPPAPMSPYALTKLDGEFYCGLFHRRGVISTVSARFFNVFGPRQDPGSSYAAAVPTFVGRALSGQELVIYGDGGQTRDFVGVDDIVSGLVHLAHQSGQTGVFNLGYGTPTSIAELAQGILQRTGSRSTLRHEASRPGEIRHSVASIERIRATGWQPQSSFAEGLSATVDWYRQQR